MRKYETLDLEFEQETLDKLNLLAKDLNMTLDELVNEILENYISKRISVEEYKNLLKKNAGETLKNFYTIIDDSGEAIARVRPLGLKSEEADNA